MLASSLLPDVAGDLPIATLPLAWVGMRGISLPLAIDEGAAVPARVDVEVDLVDPECRGIHMSRLFRLLNQNLAGAVTTPLMLQQLLDQVVASQAGLSSRARIRIALEHLAARPALVSPEAGWRAYPLRVSAEGEPGAVRVRMSIDVQYSSTCPASTALSRQVVAEELAERVAAGADALALVEWIQSSGLAATPHAQRSTARLSVELQRNCGRFDPAGLVDLAEGALGTPVQTLVRRIDEQAFARLNAQNQMFCEDAARRLASALAGRREWPAWRVEVAHHESLHAHDAVAEASHRWHR